MTVLKCTFAGVLLSLSLAGGIWAETVFVAEPSVRVRQAAGVRALIIENLHWGEKLERGETAGLWSQIGVDSSGGFVLSEWLTTYEIASEKTVAENRRAVCFEMERYLGGPVLEAMCVDIFEKEKARFPGLEEVEIKGCLAGQCPEGVPVCVGRMSSRGEALAVDVPEEGPVTQRENEIYEWLRKVFRSRSRGGRPIYACDSLWIQAGEEFGVTPLQARYVFDRVRWKRQMESESRAQDWPGP